MPANFPVQARRLRLARLAARPARLLVLLAALATSACEDNLSIYRNMDQQQGVDCVWDNETEASCADRAKLCQDHSFQRGHQSVSGLCKALSCPIRVTRIAGRLYEQNLCGSASVILQGIPAGLSGTASASMAPARAAAAFPPHTLTEYAVPPAAAEPNRIIQVDGRMVFASARVEGTTLFATIDTAGTVVPVVRNCGGNLNGVNSECRVVAITADPRGPGGACALSSFTTGIQGARDPDRIKCRPLPGNSLPAAIEINSFRVADGANIAMAIGADNQLWTVDGLRDTISRANPASLVVEHTRIEPYSGPQHLADISAGPGPAMWFTASSGNAIGRIWSDQLQFFPLPGANSLPAGIAVGVGNFLWFTEFGGNRIGRLAPNGTLLEFPIPTAGAGALGIARGPDGAIWFTESATGRIGRICHTGELSELALPDPAGQPTSIASGPNDDLWVTQRKANKIARIALAQPLGERCDWTFAGGFEF